MQVRPRAETETDTGVPTQAGMAALEARVDIGRAAGGVWGGRQAWVLAHHVPTPMEARGVPPHRISVARWASSKSITA